MKESFKEIYAGSDSAIQCELFGGQCTADEILRVTDLAKDLNPDVVVGIGGGKTMDTAKAVADNYNAATVIVPTTASTDAPAMGLSVIYTAEGEHIGARHYKKNPDLVLLDTDIIAKAPVRFLDAGIGDALATYPECRANVQSASPNYVNSGFHQTLACQAISKACHETILSKGISAKLAAEQGLCTKDVEDIIEANTLLSGLGVQNGSCAGAHSIAEGITVLPPCARLLHGEVVAFGVLVQLIVEGAPAEEIEELYEFYNEIGLPTTFADLGIADPNANKLEILKKYGFEDVVVMDRNDPSKHTAIIKEMMPKGFDICIDATGAPSVFASLFGFAHKGSKIVAYGCCPADATVPVNPYDIFNEEYTILGSFAQTHCFPRALYYLENGIIQVQDLISHVLPLEGYGEGLQLILDKKAHKVIITP